MCGLIQFLTELYEFLFVRNLKAETVSSWRTSVVMRCTDGCRSVLYRWIRYGFGWWLALKIFFYNSDAVHFNTFLLQWNVIRARLLLCHLMKHVCPWATKMLYFHANKKFEFSELFILRIYFIFEWFHLQHSLVRKFRTCEFQFFGQMLGKLSGNS